MALPSQQTGPSRRSKHSYRRKNGRSFGRAWLMLMLVLIVAAVVIWIVVGSDDSAIESNPPVASSEAMSQSVATTGSTQQGEASAPLPRPVVSVTRGDDALPAEPGGGAAMASGQLQPLARPTVEEPATLPTQPSVQLTVLPPAGLRSQRPQPEPQPAEPAASVSAATLSRPAPNVIAPPILVGGNLPLLISGSAPAEMQDGLAALQAGRIVEARLLLSQALRSDGIKASTANQIREILGDINARLVFSREIHPEDPFSITYKVQPNDSLSRIRKKLAVQTDWRFIQRINNISAPNRIRIDQTLKIITGPFHGVVERSTFTMDVYLGQGSEQVYVCTLPVGLGEYNATPLGNFRVRHHSKLVNPEWINPRDGTRYTADDPLNPIGEYWMGLEGTDDANRDMAGYGIHGTIEPDSIGRNASMGCVRLFPEDVELVYQMFAEGVSTLHIKDARVKATAAAE